MADFDHTHVLNLLQIMEKARPYGPSLQWLHDRALKELLEMGPQPKTMAEKIPPIEKSMRGATASTFSEFGTAKEKANG